MKNKVNVNSTIKELLVAHNSLSPKSPLKDWKGPKAELLGKIEELERLRRVNSTKTIRQVAEDLLLEVVTHDSQNRAVGLSYKEILETIQEKFPHCKTTVKCLRWYQADLKRNVDDETGEPIFKIPLRPRPNNEPQS